MRGKPAWKNYLIAFENKNITWNYTVYFAPFDIVCVVKIGWVDGELLWLGVETCQANQPVRLWEDFMLVK